MKNTGLIILGIAVGWLLHENFPLILKFVSNPPAATGTTLESSPIADEGQRQSSILNNGEVTPVVIGTPVASTVEEIEPGPESISDLVADLYAGNFTRVVTQCSRGSVGFKRNCRQRLVEYAGSDQIARSESRYLLELWMAENPDDLEAGTILVDQDIHEQHYVEAARRLALMQSYQTDPRGLEAIAQQTQNFARTAIIKMDMEGDRAGLKLLLEILADMEPERAAWRYSLANVQYDLGEYDSAMTSLSFILFDPVYGDRSTRLYELIVEKLNLASFSEIPLRNTGFQFLVNARVNNLHELSLILDTGASITSIRGDVLEKLGLVSENDKAIVLNTVGGQVDSSLVRLKSLSIGGQVVRRIDVANTDLGDLKADGLLGMNFLEHFRFIIDQKKRRLYLEPK